MNEFSPSVLSSSDLGRRYFEQRLAHETDVADVHEELDTLTLLDVRGEAAYASAHLPGAHSIHDGIPDGPLVVYCWGPGCNGATKACAKLAAQGREVKEMLGGFEYWVREGFPVEGARADAWSEKMARWTLLTELCSVSATPTAPVR
jgi:rhodanese-related sulfurtransferase